MSEDKRLNEIIRIKKRTNNYTVLDTGFINNSELSWKAKGILAYLLSKPDKWKVITRDLVNHATDGKGSVYKGLSELKEYGYYEKIPIRDDKGVFIRWDSVVFEVPDNVVRKNAENLENTESYPLPQNPEMDNPEVENPFVENQPLDIFNSSYIDCSYIDGSGGTPTLIENTYGEFKRVRLTIGQHEVLLTAYGRDKASDYINRLDLHIESTGKCYQSHYATIKKWIAEDESKAKQAVAPKPTQNRFANHHQREYDPDQLKQLERAYLRN